MAVYTEIEPGEQWGIRVTLCPDCAIVETIKGEKCTWYQAPEELRCEVRYPNLWERFRKISFKDKVLRSVEAKRRLAQRENKRVKSGDTRTPYARYLSETASEIPDPKSPTEQLSEAIRIKKVMRERNHGRTQQSNDSYT